MGKQDFCLCENKGADQLCSNCTADQRLCSRYMDSTTPLLPKPETFKLLAIFCSYAGLFVSDLRKTDFCLCENKGADQHLCFHYTDSTIPLLPKSETFKLRAIFCSYAGLFVSDLRKTDFCLCENKGADQPCSNCTADQRLCFRYMDSKIPLLPKSETFKLLYIAIFCSYAGRFVSDLVGNPEDRILA